MIRLDEIIIANFRSFKDSNNKVTNLNKLNVMVGKNNVGKTNVLRAIYLFFNPESYDYTVDRNMVKQITFGGSKEPKITITFVDDEIISGKQSKYKIECDINKMYDEKNECYSLKTKNDEIGNKLGSHKEIKKYLKNKFKCVYLSTTDEDIDKQSEELLNDLIFKYFRKQSNKIKKTISSFEQAYKDLMNTFEDNIEMIENDLSEQFDDLYDVKIVPKLCIQKNKDLTNFLLENINLQLDDSYVQDIGTKGAGIQRASLILLYIYLLNYIYGNKNKIILLDEPEAFLYPLLERKVKERLEESVKSDKSGNMQIFMTSHSRVFLQEMFNLNYSFFYLSQKREEKSYKRSQNKTDINKYTLIEKMDRHNKNELLRNYGLLDDINDYEYVIVCEGETDCNYIKYMLKDKEFIPQIRYGKYSDGVGPKSKDLNYKNIGRGASASLPILAYLDNVSKVKRKVFVLLDGDAEGKKTKDQINNDKYQNLDIKIMCIPNNKEIEDMVFDKETYINFVVNVSSSIKEKKDIFADAIKNTDDKDSVINQTESFIKCHCKGDTNINKIKSDISQKCDERIISDWFLKEIDPFFYND
ncbi:ATP-dependent nuclease [Lachnospira pectinoschiza]|uniref:AAA ATPase domain-containing protein n=1 Tax=Lachnospira pectinoschiza TaxID=28052 RepID=A0A1G9TIU4_9FIRM|nr:AAA family ATPase [Lachnospira pectinoschiza]SDM47696.1 AAA ATPase domain-containing protein [Lachnospira pectinoschiza]